MAFPNMPHCRRGQTLYNFLAWLHDKKGFPAGTGMADIFYLQDTEIEALYRQFLEAFYNEKR